jgi:hypothetical protein
MNAMPGKVSWKRIAAVTASIVSAGLIFICGRHLIGCSFPIEELCEDGSFQTSDLSWWSRSDIYNAARENGAAGIKLVIYAHCEFHVFDNRGRVHVVTFGESGVEPPACVIHEETYSGDPRKHAFHRSGGA